MKFDFSYEGFSDNFIVRCSAIFKKLGNTALDSEKLKGRLRFPNLSVKSLSSRIFKNDSTQLILNDLLKILIFMRSSRI